MALEHLAEPKPSDGPESTVGYFKGLLVWWVKWTKWQRFVATRKAVLAGERLMDASPAELASRNLMGPLSFNITETVFASIPSHIAAWIIVFIFAQIQSPQDAPVPPITLDAATTAEFVAATKTVARVLNPFWVPLTALCFAWVAAWGALYSHDQSRAARRRCRDAYLYVDGAIGLWPEAMWALSFTLLAQLALVDLNRVSETGALIVGLLSIGALATSCAMLLLFALREGPRLRSRLFEAIGYTGDDESARVRLRIGNRIKTPGPHTRFKIVLGFGGPILLSVLFFVIGFAASWIAVAIAIVRTTVRHAI